MKNIALYGGSFDPPTIAHELIFQKVHKQSFCDEVWPMPCFGHNFGKKPIQPHHRWAMIQILARSHSFLKPCSWELDNQHSGSMYETLIALKKLYPQNKFYIVVGMDNANSIFKWDRGDLLIKENPFIVLTRKGEIPQTNWHTKNPHQIINVELAISSTMVRESIKNDFNKAANMLNFNIWEYIVKYELYY